MLAIVDSTEWWGVARSRHLKGETIKGWYGQAEIDQNAFEFDGLPPLKSSEGTLGRKPDLPLVR